MEKIARFSQKPAWLNYNPRLNADMSPNVKSNADASITNFVGFNFLHKRKKVNYNLLGILETGSVYRSIFTTGICYLKLIYAYILRS